MYPRSLTLMATRDACASSCESAAAALVAVDVLSDTASYSVRAFGSMSRIRPLVFDSRTGPEDPGRGRRAPSGDRASECSRAARLSARDSRQGKRGDAPEADERPLRT